MNEKIARPGKRSDEVVPDAKAVVVSEDDFLAVQEALQIVASDARDKLSHMDDRMIHTAFFEVSGYDMQKVLGALDIVDALAFQNDLG